MEMEQPDPRFVQAVKLFNQQEFFTCHDVLEEIWSETMSNEREFLQGLIHAAVALSHFGDGNLGGARRMHDSAIRYLTPYGDVCRGIDLRRFRADFDGCFESLLGTHTTYPAGVHLDETRIPKLSPPRE